MRAPVVCRCVASCVVFVAGYAAGAALAATTARAIEFNIPPETLSTALVKFAVQSNISLGLGDVDACADPGRGLTGRYTVEDGLQQILNGTGCGYRVLDSRAYMIEPLPQTFASAAAAESQTVEVSELVVSPPSDPSDLAATDNLATALSHLFGSQSGAACDGCSGSEAFPILDITPVLAPRPSPDLTAEVSEPGAWATLLLGLGAIGASLRLRRDHVIKIM